MNEWIAPLLARYRAVLEHNTDPSQEIVDNFNGLRLADAVLDKLQLNQSHKDHSSQITIIGPTQAGKSTLVNVLLDQDVAGISALAAFTVHAQGFANDIPESDYAALDQVLNPLTRQTKAKLTAESLNHYSLDAVPSGKNSLVRQSVVWDSPDFDSIDARGYQSAVLATIALSDILVLMLSKDKYGDKSVWNMLELIKDLGRPIIIVINKLDEQDRNTVISAFTERYKDTFKSKCPPIIDLPFVKDGWQNLPKSSITELKGAVGDALQTIDRDQQISACNQFIESHQKTWLTPLKNELDAKRAWHAMIDEALETTEHTYVKGYLENPDKYETFNRALVELLSLLEIPGFAATLKRTRSVVTWPARKLFGIGKSAVTSAFEKNDKTTLDQEKEILDVMFSEVMTELQGQLMTNSQDLGAQQQWWQLLSRRLSDGTATLEKSYQQRGVLARKEFEPRIDATAQRLYEQLQDQPRLLNTLRAARVTADAAGVALAVKSGGLAPSDLILAPAMLSVTSLLTESALGRYLDISKRELKQEQQQHIRTRLLDGVLRQELHQMAESLDGNTLLVADLPDDVINAVESIED